MNELTIRSSGNANRFIVESNVGSEQEQNEHVWEVDNKDEVIDASEEYPRDFQYPQGQVTEDNASEFGNQSQEEIQIERESMLARSIELEKEFEALLQVDLQHFELENGSELDLDQYKLELSLHEDMELAKALTEVCVTN